MNRMGNQANAVSVVMDKLPRLSKLVSWFKGDDMNIDNHLFKLHYQVKQSDSFDLNFCVIPGLHDDNRPGIHRSLREELPGSAPEVHSVSQ